MGIFNYEKGIGRRQVSKDQEQKIQDYEIKIADYDNTILELKNGVEIDQKHVD